MFDLLWLPGEFLVPVKESTVACVTLKEGSQVALKALALWRGR